MNRTTPIVAMTLLLGAGVLFFPSCASNEIKNPQPPVTQLNPDPASAPDTKPEAAAGTVAPQANQGSNKRIASSHKTHPNRAHAAPVVLAAPAALAFNAMPAPVAANVQTLNKNNGNGWPWLLLLLLLLLLLALARQLWSRYQREKALAAKEAGIARRGLLAKVAALAHQAMLAKRSRAAHRAKLVRDAETAREAKLAAEALLVHEAMLAKRARLAHKAKLAREAQSAHEAELAKEAGLARKKSLLAKVAALAHRLKLSKRSRLAHKARLARDAEAAHEAKMAKVAASAHKAKLAKNAQLANKVILAASAPSGPQMILGKDTRFAPKEVLAKGPGKTQETSAKNAFTGEAALVQEKPSSNEGIGAVGAEYSHPDGLAKDAGPMREGFLAKDTGLTPKLILTEAVGLAAKGILAKDSPSAREGPLVGSAGLAGDEILVQGAGLTEVVKVSIKLGATFEEIIVSVARMGNFPAKKAYLFLEDSQVPLNPKHRLDSKHPRHLVHHVHTQKEIMVMVQFNGRESIKRFSPATTVRKVLAWASHEFKMPDHDGTEVFLTVPGSIVPLPDAVHIGRYVPHDQNKLALNVMTPARV